jgi:beta-glucuronidase
MKLCFSIAFIVALLFASNTNAQNFKEADVKNIALYPQQNDIRNALNISGIWKFKKDSANIGEAGQWYNGLSGSTPIAVPGSWNEQLDDMRDYLGLAWYEQNSYVPKNWKGQKIYLRVGSANYAAKVWVNGKPVGTHQGGALPFAFEITNYINWDAQNRVTISVENILKPGRVPVGGLPPGGMFNNNPRSNFDFFPYCGLQRPVWLYATSKNAVTDITVKTTINGNDGMVEVALTKEGISNSAKIKLEGDGQSYESNIIFTGNSAVTTIKVPAAHLWNMDDPFLYNLVVTLNNAKETTDKYELPVGIRTVSTNSKQILLNGKPVFLKGFGKHEDFPVFGKGTAYPVIVKDYNLLKWIGANSYRTSHYPYDEEYMNMADREGILIIDEIPAVGLYFDSNIDLINERKEMCRQQIKELVTRDKNHPSVIMWSLANEPIAAKMEFGSGKKIVADEVSLNFFKELFKTVKEADNTRLSVIVGLQGGPDEWLNLSDVVCINRYYGWYSQNGDIKTAAKIFSDELDYLYNQFHKPILVTEFGADTYPGMHADQPEMFTEEFQVEFIKTYLDVADTKDFVTGMHIWAFADFKTTQGVIRFGGMNWKGVFTRDRKPKMSAHYLKARWNKK